MTLEIKVLGWSTSGLRCIDHEVDFRNGGDKPHKISLIQMPNGNGKTTTLQLLRAALSGGDIGDIRKFAKTGSETGQFELKLLLNKKRTTIRMDFDFGSGKMLYSSTRAQGKVAGFDPPSEFRKFMNEEFVHFFVFDGELASNLLNQHKTNADAVIDHLFQINVLKVVSERVKKHWEDYRNTVSAGDQSGVTKRTNKVTGLAARLRLAEHELSQLNDQRKLLEASIRKLTAQFDREATGGKKAQEDLIAARNEIIQIEKKSRETAIGLLDQLRDPCAVSSAIANNLMEFKGGLDRVKLPESAAREFFEELAEEEYCICGRAIDESVASSIRERAMNYLGSDDVSLLNAIKTAIEGSAGASSTLAEDLWNRVHDLDRHEKDRATAQTKLDRLIEMAKVDPKVKESSDKLDQLKAELIKVIMDLEKFDDDDESIPDHLLFCIRVIKAKLKKAEDDLAEITETVQIKAKRDILVSILDSAWSSASRKMKEELQVDANSRINELLPNNKIQIDGIDGALRLKGKESGSVGETLSVAYAFLSCLYNRAQHRLPFIVDSPAGPLDLDVRPEISSLIPKLSEQFIAFLISSELQGFTKPLADSCDDIQYLTIFRRGIDKYDRAAKKQAGTQESADGFIVPGQKFFESFQMEEQS